MSEETKSTKPAEECATCRRLQRSVDEMKYQISALENSLRQAQRTAAPKAAKVKKR